MSSRISYLIIALLFVLSNTNVQAQDNDYLKHRKFFDICSIKKQCRECYTCEQNRYLVKLNNKDSKNITHVYYKFYSPVYNKIIEKEAKISGDKIEGKKIGQVYVCVINGTHWIFSRIGYADGSEVKFTLHDRMESFLQEPDECDCND